MEVIEHALHVLANCEGQYRIYQQLVARAGVSLDPSCAWLLFRIEEQAPISGRELAKRLRVPPERLTTSVEQLSREGLVAITPQVVPLSDGQRPNGQIEQITLTSIGQQTYDKLTSAYHQSLTELLDGWSPEQETELATLLQKLTSNLRTDTGTLLLT
jgi:DNA-binding MarR family transcriptional regulator